MTEQYVKFQTAGGLWNILEVPNKEHAHYYPVDGPFESEKFADKVVTLWNDGERVKGVPYNDEEIK